MLLITLIITTLTLVHSTTFDDYDIEESNYAANLTDAIEKQYKVNKILKDVYATISHNTRENSRKLTLENFSWGIFSGTHGHLKGFNDFNLVNNKTIPMAQKRKLNISFEFTVPILQAEWEKSTCFGYHCVMTMELKNAVFVMRMVFDAKECVIDHLAYLKMYDNAKCYVSYMKSSSVSTTIVQGTIKLLSQLMNTEPFEMIIKNNVNYALLQLPLFNVTDIRRICDAYQEI